MAFSGGTFSRTFDCTTDRDNGVKILASKFDTELDGMATGLSTCILKDGTQTCTAAIPFAQGITLPDDKTIAFGTNSDVLIQYDETTTDSLKISAAEGAGLAITLMADEGDDAGDEWKLNIADGGTLTLGNDINSAGTYVTHLTITPNATVANSTMAVAGNLTVGGDLTLGSGAVITEAELEMIDGITPGTVLASKAMVVDSDKDITGGRNLTITGELDAATLDISGNADIDGTLEADAMTLNGSAITTVATLSTGISNGNLPVFTSGAADNDFLRIDGTAIEGRSAAEVLSDIAAAPAAGSSNIVTTGALNSGSITSGFGSIDNGSSAITTTGAISGGSFVVADGANIGSVSDTDAIAIASNGQVTLTQTLIGTALDISGDIDVDGTTNLDVVDIDGAVDMASTLQVDGAITSSAGATITTADNTSQLTLVSTDADANRGPQFDLHRNSASPADDDALGYIRFIGENDASEAITYARLEAQAADVTDGTEDGLLAISTMVNGTIRERVKFDATGVIFNEGSIDQDFRVESNDLTHMLFVDCANNRVGINAAAPVNTDLQIGTNSGSLALGAAASGNGTCRLKLQGSDTQKNWQIGTNNQIGGAFEISQSSSGGNTTYTGTPAFYLSNAGNLVLAGSISKGSGSFKIPHPLEAKKDSHNLVHSFVEGPQADNLYRGKVALVDGTATQNIDTVAGMTEGTFAALNREVQCFTTNETGWTAVKGSVSGNVLTITAQENTCTDTISWMVIGERKDQHMYDTDWTDDDGKVIVEPEVGSGDNAPGPGAD